MRDLNGKTSKLSKLIKSGNLVNVSSKNSFDKLLEKILSNLYKEQTELKIGRILGSELSVTFGLCGTDFDAKTLTKEIMT